MSQETTRTSSPPPALRLREQLLSAFDGLERTCTDLGSGLGIAHDGDRTTALVQLRAAQELIRGVGMRLREESGLPAIGSGQLCAGCGALRPEPGDAYCVGCRSALDRGANPADWPPTS